MYLSMRVVMAKNHGLITAGQARDCGLTTLQIAHLVRSGALVPVRHGVYTDGDLWRSLDEDRGQHRLRSRAAVLVMRRHWVLSHDSSAHEHELEILNPPQPHVHITRPGSTAAWTRAGVKHHLARYNSDQVEKIDGLDVLNLARTAVDIARELGPPYGEIACDAVMRRGIPKSGLEDALAIMHCWPGVRSARSAVAFARPEAANLAETMARILVAELQIGEIDPQFPVRLESGRIAWGDIRVGCHIFEFHGEIKFRPPSDGGVASDPPHKVIWAARKRDIELGREGLGTSHIVWQDFWPPHRALAKKRLLVDYQDTTARFGDQLPERLARQARELRGRRGA
jgi:hypothetical protein